MGSIDESLLGGIGHVVVRKVLRDTLHCLGIGTEVGAQGAHQVTTEDDGQRRSHGVGTVPDRHLRGQFRGMDPMRKHAGTRREAHALEVLVQDNRHAHDQDEGLDEAGPILHPCDPRAEVGTETEGEVGNGTEYQTRGHYDAGADAVHDISVDETRETVNQRAGKENPAEALVRDTKFGRQTRHGQREVLTYEIEQGISHHRHQDGAPLPIFELLVCFHII